LLIDLVAARACWDGEYMIIIQAVFYIMCIIIVLNIILLASNKTSQKAKAVNKFCLGILLMVISYIAGFSIGAYIIIFAVVVWANILINSYNDIKIRLAAAILLIITFMEASLLLPG
jgi:hypothetical protein